MWGIGNWTVREANAEDSAALAFVGSATFLESYAGLVSGQDMIAHCAVQHSDAAYRNFFTSGARAWVAEAEVGAAPLGYSLLTTPDLPEVQAGDIELRRIYTLTICHGHGVGPALMEQAVLAATTDGHKRLLLGVNDQNDRALTFYRKQGFTPVGTRQMNVAGRLYDDLVLARPLQA